MTYETINDAVTRAGGAGALLANRYRIVRQLGQGGMGSVWLAEDTQLDNKPFAIKMLPSILVSNKRAYRQLKDEALVAMQLVHPNIVQIRAFEENSGNPFLVMDYVDGQTLDDYIADKGTLTEDETMRLLKPVAAALDYAHGEGVVHRDVKPANVMIRKDGRPFVLDFGIAREMQETMTRVTGNFSSGTLLYMSPEQLNGEPPAATQDVYSFAAMVYECLKGEPPFVRGQIEYQIINNPPPPLPEGIASWLVESILGGLNKKSDARPSTCCELLRDGERDDKDLVDGGDFQIQQAVRAFKVGDYVKAFSIAQQADISNPQIQYIIGRCYELGQGVEEERYKAVEWYRKAANQNHASAQYEIGNAYYWGLYLDKDAYKADHVEAAKWYRKAAENGHVDAQIFLGGLYENGDGVEKDEEQANKWYRKAEEKLLNEALRGDAEAQCRIGDCYHDGECGKTDKEEALRWYRQAAEHGHATAQFRLADMYLTGDGISQDYEEAIKWYREAAALGFDEASKMLGDLYKDGEGIAQDSMMAAECYRKAAAQNNDGARIALARMYSKGDGVAQDYKEAVKWYLEVEYKDEKVNYELGLMYENGYGVEKNYQMAVSCFRKAAISGNLEAAFRGGYIFYYWHDKAKHYERAAEWFGLAAKRGHAGAQYFLGLMHHNGEGVEQNYEKAANWFRKAAEQGHADAQFRLGSCLKDGKGVTKDDAEAANWYLKAAEQGNADAQSEIGLAYFWGYGVPCNQSKGIEWTRKAAEQGNVEAQCRLGGWYANWHDAENIIVPQDYVESFKWYKKAAGQGDKLSQYRLGEMYYKGLGVAQNYAEAIKVFRKFADQHSDAKFRLGMMYRNGEGVAQDFDEAVKLLKDASGNGSNDAAYELGVMYEKGICVQKDLAEAIDWYRTAASRENEKAVSVLEMMAADAYGTNVDVGNVGEHYEDTLVLPGGQKVEMIYCPPGEFLMGSPLIEEMRETDEVQHRVTITKGFWLGKYPITQEQWECVMKDNPSFPRGINCPVNNVTWNDCQKFIRRLNSLVGYQTRLPTEAEWEYACRAGTRTMFYWGNCFDGSQANFRGVYRSSNRVCDPPDIPAPIDKYAPNAWGFYDMLGNILEWCEDWYAEYNSDSIDPHGPVSGNQKVMRGGCQEYLPESCRSASRHKWTPDSMTLAGFRLCCTAE